MSETDRVRGDEKADAADRGKAPRQTVPVDRRALSAHDDVAAALRRRFADSGTLVVNLISAPGSGKTELISKTCEILKDALRLGAVAGDVQTDLDAERIARAGVAACAIETHGACHLSASQVAEALARLPQELDVLFIENVGNLVCPTSFDLGEDAKVALVSLPEGDDKPAKYPAIFSKARAFVITKTDLAPSCPADRERMRRDARRLNPAIAVFELSARSGEGLEAWCDWLRGEHKGKRA